MNAREELLRLLAEHRLGEEEIEAAVITLDTNYGLNPRVFTLRKGHAPLDRTQFLRSLNFEYDDGYGGQELYGIIWFHGTTWATRGEYDGSEWWEYHQRPELPSELKGENT